MDSYSLLADWVGWPIVVVLLLLAGGYGFWIINHRIEALKEKNSWLEAKVKKAENYSPSALVERLAARHKILNEELEIIHREQEADKQRIDQLEAERIGIAEELDNIAFQLFKAHETCEYKCMFCHGESPPQNKGTRRVGFPVKFRGTQYMVDIEAKCHDCGRKTVNIQNLNDGN